MGEAMAVGAGTVAGVMVATWLISGLVKDASIVDLVWGLGFVLVAWAVYLTVTPDDALRSRAWWVVVLTSIWGLRLSIYLAWRNLGKGEDYRYRAMRAKHGNRFFWVSLATVFGLQGVLMWVVSLPVQAAVARPSAAGVMGPFLVLGTALWTVGLFFEAVGDWQLARFKADPANQGKVMDRGLWRYTRHPNYFGDFCVWWGLYLIALEAGHWWTIIGALVMSILLLRYSGVGLLEKTIVNRRPEYADYIKRTNAFFPGPPRSRS